MNDQPIHMNIHILKYFCILQNFSCSLIIQRLYLCLENLAEKKHPRGASASGRVREGIGVESYLFAPLFLPSYFFKLLTVIVVFGNKWFVPL
ncbi:MAG: hypothetical protein D6814_15840 [Calditrichaeota bacterium]|nr:MAG: hypothetical protein D6814_15840 [Calditrichota bacterium]